MLYFLLPRFKPPRNSLQILTAALVVERFFWMDVWAKVTFPNIWCPWNLIIWCKQHAITSKSLILSDTWGTVTGIFHRRYAKSPSYLKMLLITVIMSATRMSYTLFVRCILVVSRVRVKENTLKFAASMANLKLNRFLPIWMFKFDLIWFGMARARRIN